jgi:hypothetical protein
MDCTTAIVKNFSNDKFRCLQAKCEAIITNVIATKQIDKELKRSSFHISINRLIKPLGQKGSASCPEILSCRKRCEGVGVNLGGETSELFFTYVLEVLQKLDLF